MMQLVQQTQLVQQLTDVPNAIWATERVNRGYSGPIVTVRRSSDNTTKQCYSHNDIVSHCTGTNGFVSVFYDQTGSGFSLTDVGGTGVQPKIYDSSTGLLKIASGKNTVVLQFDGSDDVLQKTDALGFGSANIAVTTAWLAGTWTNTGVTAWSMGPDTGGASPDCWYCGHGASTTLTANARGVSRTFDVTDPSGFPSAFIYAKPSGGDFSDVTLRQNKSDCAQNSVTTGTMAFSSAGCVTRLGAAVTGLQWAAMTTALLAHWNATLSTADRDAVEQYLDRMRTV